MQSADVVVVGGGPAGSAAAITLARADRHVILVDKATFPREKCCGDGLTAMALRILEDLGLSPSQVPSWQVVQDTVVVGPNGREMLISLPEERGAYMAVAERRELDAALLDVARDSGVEVLEAHAVTDVRTQLDRVTLEVDRLGRIDAHYVIGADGMWSPLRRLLGIQLEGYRGDWHAFRQYFSQVSPRASSQLAIWFEPDLLPGYAWSFPLSDSRANVGFAILREPRLSGAKLKEIWATLPDRAPIADFLGTEARPEGTHRAWPIPTRLPGPSLSHGRVLFVGDAAALGDPMTGEGVGQALASAVAAAESLIESGPFDPMTATRSYHRWIQHNLWPDNQLAGLLSRALKHRKGVRAAIALADISPWTRNNFGRWLYLDEPRAAVATPNRLHRKFLRRDGAYLHG